MAFKRSQLMIAAGAGLTTAIVVAYATIQSQTIPSSGNETAVVLPTVIASTPATQPVTSTAEPRVIHPPTSDCPIRMAIVDDPSPPLNVRSHPEVKLGNVVGQLENQTFVSVAQQRNGWLKIRDPLPGWIAQNRTRSSCADIIQPLNLSAYHNSAIIQGELIGSGRHGYTFQGHRGQTLTLKSNSAVFPNIIQPDGRLLVENSRLQGDRSPWVGQLSITGTYTIEFNSNFRGFKYDFWVQIDE